MPEIRITNDTLDLHGFGLIDAQAAKVVDVLQSKQPLLTVKLGRNNFSASGMHTILKALKEHSDIEKLDLSLCSIGDNLEIINLLASLTHLKELNLYNTGLNTQGASQLYRSLKTTVLKIGGADCDNNLEIFAKIQKQNEEIISSKRSPIASFTSTFKKSSPSLGKKFNPEDITTLKY